MNAFQFGQRVKQALGPGNLLGQATTGMRNLGNMVGQGVNQAAQGVKNVGTAANNWSAKNLGLAMPNRAELGAAYSGAANNAIQSPMGQKVLGGVATGYNQFMPQAGKDFIGRQMPTYAEPDEMKYMQGRKNVAPTPYQPLGQQYGTHVNSNTVVKNDQLVKDQIDTNTPARVTGSPMQQLGFGLSHGQMPQQTFPQGNMANLHRRVENDQLTQNRLTAPHPAFSHLK